MWEKKVGELQARCSASEEEKYEALAKVRESVQVAEEAALQKDQVRHPGLPFLLSPRVARPSLSAVRVPIFQHLFPLSLTRCLCLPLQALLREKQKAEELEKTKEAIRQFTQDAAVRTRKEVSGSSRCNPPGLFCSFVLLFFLQGVFWGEISLLLHFFIHLNFTGSFFFSFSKSLINAAPTQHSFFQSN